MDKEIEMMTIMCSDNGSNGDRIELVETFIVGAVPVPVLNLKSIVNESYGAEYMQMCEVFISPENAEKLGEMLLSWSKRTLNKWSEDKLEFIGK